MKIQIFGNSVGLNVRPNTDSKVTYAKLLENKWSIAKGHIIMNKCKWNLMITDQNLEEFANEILQVRADYVILNFGINESVPRTLPKSLWRILNSQDGRQSKLKIFINKLIKYLSPTLIKRFNLKGWITKDVFLGHLQKRIELIEKETDAKIIVLGITSVNGRTEKMIPNVNKIIREFNGGILNLLQNKERCYFIEVFDLANETGDGIHYTAKGHKLLFERICCCIEEE